MTWRTKMQAKVQSKVQLKDSISFILGIWTLNPM
jgi:hypothetical protein